MAAITWQNINGPSVAQAASPLGDAQKTLSGMFSGFEDILTKRAAVENANWDQTKVNNTNAFLAATQEAKTPEEFAAREAMLREQLKSYGAQVDPAAARAALDGRTALLQQRSLANQQYTDQQAEVAGRSGVAGYDSAISAIKTPADAQSLRESLGAATGAGAIDPRASAALMNKLRAAEDARVVAGRATTTFEQGQELWPIQKQQLEANVAKTKADTEEINRVRQEAGVEKATAANVAKMHAATVGAQQQRTQGILGLAKARNIPIDPETGVINPRAETGQTPEIMAQFEKDVNEKFGPPVSTSQTNDAVRTFLAASGLPVGKQNQLLKDYDTATTDGSNASATDANKLKLLKETQKLEKETFLKTNPFVNPDADKPAEIMKVLNLASGIKDYRASSTVPAALNTWLTKGFEHNGVVKDVPPKVLEQAISSIGGIQKDTALWNSTISELEVKLTELFDDPKTAKQIEAAKNFETMQNQAKGSLVKTLRIVPEAGANDIATRKFLENNLATLNAAAEAANKPKK